MQWIAPERLFKTSFYIRSSPSVVWSLLLRAQGQDLARGGLVAGREFAGDFDKHPLLR